MSLNPEPAFADVDARLRTIISRVYDAEIPEDEATPTDAAGQMLPYIVAMTGGPIRSRRDRNLVTARRDGTILYWTIATYAPTASLARAYKGRVVDSLTGFRPTDCGELVLDGGMEFTRASNSYRPTVYINTVHFSTVSNLSWTDEVE